MSVCIEEDTFLIHFLQRIDFLSLPSFRVGNTICLVFKIGRRSENQSISGDRVDFWIFSNQFLESFYRL